MAASSEATNSTYMTTSSTPKPLGGSSGSVKPTLLAFHGSGSNSTIHTVQLARLSRFLKKDFEIESMEGPFPCPAGPGILPFFEGMGPYKRWVPPSEKLTFDGMKDGIGMRVMPEEVEELVRSTVQRIRSQGGRVVGLIGFSQGTKVVAGLLRGCEIRRALASEEHRQAVWKETDWCEFSFGLSFCGSYPPPLTPRQTLHLITESELSKEDKFKLETSKIQIPTLHVQGEVDEWKWTGKLLIDGCYEVAEGKSEVWEHEGGHHYPQKMEVTEGVVEWVQKTWERAKEGEQTAQ
jgi:predicted esterase